MMCRFLAITILCLVSVSLVSHECEAKRHRLQLEDDVRKYIALSSFGFYKGGFLEVTLHEFAFSPYNPDGKFGFSIDHTASDSINPYMETNKDKCLLEDESVINSVDASNAFVLFIMDLKDNVMTVKCSPQLQTIQIEAMITSQLPEHGKAGQKKKFPTPLGLPYRQKRDVPSFFMKATSDTTLFQSRSRRSAKSAGPTAAPVSKEAGNICSEIAIPLSQDNHTTVFSSNFSIRIRTEKEEGLYSFYFHNCENYKGNQKTSVKLDISITEKNEDSFLSAGEMPLPALYFMMSFLFCLTGIFWLFLLHKSWSTVFKVHYLMGILVFTKSLSLLFHGINYHFIEVHGVHLEAWAVLYYITHLLKGALLFITIVLIGTGWAFIKHVLSPKDKRIFMIVIPLQVLANVALIITEETEEGEIGRTVWQEIFILIDLICCGAILLPVVWSIRHLQEASETDGKAALNLKKLKLFRHFYIMIVCYIYFTRIIVYLLRLTLPFRYEWLDEMFHEMATFVFFVLTGYKFRPASNNPYLQVPVEDEETVEDEVLTETGLTQNVVKLNRERRPSRNGHEDADWERGHLLKGEASDATLDDVEEQRKERKDHSLQMNVTTGRVWCHSCDKEVFLDNNKPPLGGVMETVTDNIFYSSSYRRSSGDGDEDFDMNENEEDDFGSVDGQVRGLTGLQNFGVTCYMNAAIQALSNTIPLTSYFLYNPPTSRHERKTMPSQDYRKLVHAIWGGQQPPACVSPSEMWRSVRLAIPAFRGFQQQDTQEFLRCFMDHLHEDLKERVLFHADNGRMGGGDHMVQDDSDTAPSEEGYETCDSGVSDDLSSTNSPQPRTQKQRISRHKKQQSMDVEEDEVPQGDVDAMEFSDASDSFPVNHLSRMRNPVLHLPTSRSSSPAEKNSSGSCHQGKNGQSYRSIISDIFDGKILSTVQCNTCSRVSSTKETFQDLSLPIPSREFIQILHQGTPLKAHFSSCPDMYQQQGWLSYMWSWLLSWFWGPSVDLHDCLGAFFSADELKGDNMYSCEKCKKLRNGIKYSRVLELPEVLGIHLKRFRHEFMFSSKIGNHVSFPLKDLDMSTYIHKDCASQVMKYDLFAVICHHGGVGGGHYTAYCLNPLNNQWYEYDDQCVTRVSPDVVRKCEAYVLFYKKYNEKILRQRDEVRRIEDNMVEPNLLPFYISRRWLNRFHTFSEPGPIDNSDIVCPHDRVWPQKMDHVKNLVVKVHQGVWDYLHECFGGGPACNYLVECVTCRQEQQRLAQRQSNEVQQYEHLHREFMNGEHEGGIFAVSMTWFNQWRAFVLGKEPEPPGPIDNSPIAVNKNGTFSLKPNSHYAQFSEDIWQFLRGIYGGGPELLLSSNRPISSTVDKANLLDSHNQIISETSSTADKATLLDSQSQLLNLLEKA
ncbi:unnamed protein product [Darwinula stevensoni]|uniref:Ubiquitinyl hydrolase 1 n=1 Tax=Darwinula stevensoni TaxID=69355 RepID=A0A7R9FNQ8_9CRUS|nr:unnamed protein product [Darwinula stevensoni]CAG0897077.1 unnamed protein product [Darwinula stevensoni]